MFSPAEDDDKNFSLRRQAWDPKHPVLKELSWPGEQGQALQPGCLTATREAVPAPRGLMSTSVGKGRDARDVRVINARHACKSAWQTLTRINHMKKGEYFACQQD